MSGTAAAGACSSFDVGDAQDPWSATMLLRSVEPEAGLSGADDGLRAVGDLELAEDI